MMSLVEQKKLFWGILWQLYYYITLKAIFSSEHKKDGQYGSTQARQRGNRFGLTEWLLAGI